MQGNLMQKFSCAMAYIMLAISCTKVVQADEIKITSWNIEWLTTKSNWNIQQSKRSEKDLTLLAGYVQKIAPDILAFQEVDSHDAIKKLVGDDYIIYLSDRHARRYVSHQFRDINQYTGFAVHRRYQITDNPDLIMHSSPATKLRFASYITLQTKDSVHSKTTGLHLLSVHLKAGCRGQYRKSSSCRTLRQEADRLNQWMQERVERGEHFMILGDFNHDLTYPQDWLWQRLTAGVSNSVSLTTRNTSARCQVRSRKKPGQLFQYRRLIDHIIASNSLNVPTSEQNLYQPADVINYRLSDHCPLTATVSTSNTAVK